MTRFQIFIPRLRHVDHSWQIQSAQPGAIEPLSQELLAYRTWVPPIPMDWKISCCRWKLHKIEYNCHIYILDGKISNFPPGPCVVGLVPGVKSRDRDLWHPKAPEVARWEYSEYVIEICTQENGRVFHFMPKPQCCHSSLLQSVCFWKWPAALIKKLPTCLLRRFHFSHKPLLSL